MPERARDDIAALGYSVAEGEGAHLLRVAKELGHAHRALIDELSARLTGDDPADRLNAAEEMGQIEDAEAIAVLRRVLEGQDPMLWEAAIRGLRQSRERDGWLCLESVALAQVPDLAESDGDRARVAACRLLMMGRTKTMDRLFRAADGHSRSISRDAAVRFLEHALKSLPELAGRVLSLRLGVAGGQALTPAQVAEELGLPTERVRQIESQAWQTVQAPRRVASLNGAQADGAMKGFLAS